MHTTITRTEAIAFYKNATKAIKYDNFNGAKIVVFQSNDKALPIFVQVNTFPTGRVECFAQPLDNLVDNIFDVIMDEEYETAIRLK